MFDLKTIKSQLGKKIFKGNRVKMVEKHCTHLCSEKLMDWNDLQKYLEMTDSLWEHSIPHHPKEWEVLILKY